MKWNVLVTRDCTESTTVDVEADTAEEAKTKALEEAHDNASGFDWVADDGSGHDPYIADEDEAAQPAEEQAA